MGVNLVGSILGAQFLLKFKFNTRHAETYYMNSKKYKYYDFIVVAFVTVLLCSNLIGAGKVAKIDLPLFGELTFGAGILFFPISYFFGDILTEVYGYARSRKVVWAGFSALAFAGSAFFSSAFFSSAFFS